MLFVWSLLFLSYFWSSARNLQVQISPTWGKQASKTSPTLARLWLCTTVLNPSGPRQDNVTIDGQILNCFLLIPGWLRARENGWNGCLPTALRWRAQPMRLRPISIPQNCCRSAQRTRLHTEALFLSRGAFILAKQMNTTWFYLVN